MKHRSTTSFISSLMLASLTLPSMAELDVKGPSAETICTLQLFARAYNPTVSDKG